MFLPVEHRSWNEFKKTWLQIINHNKDISWIDAGSAFLRILVLCISTSQWVALKCLYSSQNKSLIAREGVIIIIFIWEIDDIYLTDDRYLVLEITVTKRLVVSKIYLTGWSRLVVIDNHAFPWLIVDIVTGFVLFGITRHQ